MTGMQLGPLLSRAMPALCNHAACSQSTSLLLSRAIGLSVLERWLCNCLLPMPTMEWSAESARTGRPNWPAPVSCCAPVQILEAAVHWPAPAKTLACQTVVDDWQPCLVGSYPWCS